MAVRTGDRNPNNRKLTAIDASKDLISYTYDRVHDKTLPKADRWLMCKTIWDNCSKARALIVRSNSIKVECREDAVERLLEEKLAIGYLDSLIADIDTLHIKGKISDDRAEHWTKLAATTQLKTKARLKANRQAYQEYLK